MIFLKKDHHPVCKLNALGLLRLERTKRRHWNLLPVCGLGSCVRQSGRQCGNRKNYRESDSLCPHCAPPCSDGLCSPPPPGTVSITPTVRLVSLKVSLATRRMSAFVTLSIRSTELNNSRQSP